tara:strand:+ start:79 stop:678 length:600 start_codon:yes stop_codon:yes gene_type:complete
MCVPYDSDAYGVEKGSPGSSALNPLTPDSKPTDRWKDYREEYGHAPYFTYANDKYNPAYKVNPNYMTSKKSYLHGPDGKIQESKYERGGLEDYFVKQDKPLHQVNVSDKDYHISAERAEKEGIGFKKMMLTGAPFGWKWDRKYKRSKRKSRGGGRGMNAPNYSPTPVSQRGATSFRQKAESRPRREELKSRPQSSRYGL